ncbi:FACT complex component Spt16 [Mizugakiibacter sediminis]|uniref:FACT complex component Spt16 n=2 Tax=Mizugakiibacter sediminis TaxID=1475481 RepID=A0A0K8QPQ5_9GAMM|nr:FACT complex component Spt16 [Mizugakiibacter sediminis]
MRATTAILLTAALATAVATARADEAPAATRAEIVSITREPMDARASGKAEVRQSCSPTTRWWSTSSAAGRTGSRR